MFRSFPALRQALSRMEQIEPVESAAAAFEGADLVPAYAVPGDGCVEEEAKALAAAVAILAERTVRLEMVYEQWQPFEPGPYFDLCPSHVALICDLEERGSLVHVRLYADLLSPSFRAAERFCVEQFLPIVRASQADVPLRRATWAHELHERAWPILQERLIRAEQVIDQAVDSLTQAGHVSFMVAWGAAEERRRTSPRGRAPTLTLDFTFPLPLSRRHHRREVLRRRLQLRRAAGRPLLRRSGPERPRRTDSGE